MNESAIISKMNEFEFGLNQKINDWLQAKLPSITDDWWNELVVNNLSDLQKEQVTKNDIHELKGLDLASLLRVLDRNWFVITSAFFLNNKFRNSVHDMMGVRNSWAHITTNDINKEKVLRDAQTILILMEAFGAPMSETRSLETFILDIEDDNEIQPTEIVKPDIMPVTSVVSNNEIMAGSLVCLVSDENTIGAVINISGDRYTVLMGTQKKTFYREQIKLVQNEDESKKVSINRIRAALTAHQINNPGSSNLYSLNAARIDFVPYQFRPALKMIKSDSPRILVADDVGVGKTIEAGLILKELEARAGINSVLIICPRPLVVEHKWKEEMKRFDESFTELDGKTLDQAISDTDRDGEWPERHAKTILSYSLFSETTVDGTIDHGERKSKRMGLTELDPVPHFDLVIVDEAHHIRNANTWMYKGVEVFCKNAGAVVFLTATPLQNSTRDLYTLLNLLRPDVIYDHDTFQTMAEPNQYINILLSVVRMQKEGWQEQSKDLIAQILNTTYGRNVIQHNPKLSLIYDALEKDSITREEKVEILSYIEEMHTFSNIINRTRRRDIEDFCIRRTVTVNSEFNGIQRDLYDAVIDFENKALGQIHGTSNTMFMMCTIMRQASSCLYGLAPFIKDFIKRRIHEIEQDGELYEYDFEMNSDDENSVFELADEITGLVDKLPENDPKFNTMLEIIQNKEKEENNKIIVFSSFRHTLRYIYRKLRSQGIRVGQIDGGVDDETRRDLSKRFRSSRENTDAIDVLLFTEVGCEGLDYQFCDTMINYDLPWNPMRIEQRIGRIDRRGQKSNTVKIYNLITDDTIDATIYNRCLNKIGVFEASIGDCSEILGDITNQITKIMFDPELTDEEKTLKIEKMADNDVMKVQELRSLEQDEKTLFGFDLSNYVMNKDVQDAENQWISPDSMNLMVNMFLNDLLGEGEYLRGKAEQKSLRLSMDKRLTLLDNLKEVPYVNNNMACKIWKNYLASEKPILPLTFDSTYAKENSEIPFLTQMHPLVQQAAVFESNNFACEIGINVSDEEIQPGDYEFLIYSWKYMGLRPDVKLIAISNNVYIQENVLSMLQFGTEYNFDSEVFTDSWDKMDRLHYEKWNTEKEKYAEIVASDCDYRIEQLTLQFSARKLILEKQAQVDDEKIRRMRLAQVDKLKIDMTKQKNKYNDIVAHADIHTNLLVKGIVHIG